MSERSILPWYVILAIVTFNFLLVFSGALLVSLLFPGGFGRWN